MLILLVWINICCNYEGDGATNGLAVFRNTFVTKPVFFTLIVNSSLDWSGSFYIVTEFLRAENAEIHVGFNPIWLLRAL